ncbi:MAG: mannonate dehydratase, partial [Candidatus Latescibacterota bacterium]
NDPPPPVSRGSGQISLEGWKRLVDIVPSPHNGITYDPGVTREIGEDPVAVCRYFGERGCINHAHYRNVRMRVPREQYTEVFLDEGEVDMFAVMRELVRQGYPRLVYPEHPPDRRGPRASVCGDGRRLYRFRIYRGVRASHAAGGHFHGIAPADSRKPFSAADC